MANHLFEVLVEDRRTGRMVVGPFPCWSQSGADGMRADLEVNYPRPRFDVCVQHAAEPPAAADVDELVEVNVLDDGLQL